MPQFERTLMPPLSRQQERPKPYYKNPSQVAASFKVGAAPSIGTAAPSI